MKSGIFLLIIILLFSGCSVSDRSSSSQSGETGKKNPKVAKHLRTAEAYIQVKRLIEAREEYLKAEALAKNEPEVWQGIALTSYHLGDHAKSLLYCEKMIENTPNSLLALFYAGKASLEMKKPQEAIAFFEKAKAVQASSSLDFYLGLCYKAMKNHQKEADCYEAALLLSPDNLDTRWDLAVLYQKLMVWEKAQNAFEEIERRNPSFSNDLSYRLAQVYIAQGKIDEAKKQIQIYTTKEPQEKDRQEDLQVELREIEHKAQRQLVQKTEKQNRLKELENCTSIEELERRISLASGKINREEVRSMGIYEKVAQKESESQRKQ